MTDQAKPIGGGGARHPNSLANLVPGAGAWQPGASPHLVHGLRSRKPASIVLDPVVREIEAALADDLPIKGADGSTPGHSRVMVELAAVALLRVRRVESFLALHGTEDARGRWRPENDAAVKATEAAAKLLDRLGLSARSAAALGVDVSRMGAKLDPSTVIAMAREEQDPAIRAELLRSIGLDGGGGGIADGN
jgi:hypothetical protein